GGRHGGRRGRVGGTGGAGATAPGPGPGPEPARRPAGGRHQPAPRADAGGGTHPRRPRPQPPKTWRRTAATFWKIRTPNTTATAVARSALNWSPIHTRSTATAALLTKASTNSRSENVCSRWARKPPNDESMAATTAMARYRDWSGDTDG